MDGYIKRANIDHYLVLLNGADLGPDKRTVITNLLIEEEDRFGDSLAQLQFAEDRVAKGRDRVNHLRNLRDAFVPGSTDRVEADRVLANSEAIQQLLERFCRHMREKVNSRGL